MHLYEIKKSLVSLAVPTTTVYCDLDGVLADYVRAMESATGIPFEKEQRRHPEEKRALRTSEFWASIPMLPDAPVLLSWLQKNHPNYQILSACPKDPGDFARAKSGKMAWIKKHLKIQNPNRVLFVQRSEKKDYAVGGSGPCILIDDYPKNIAEWVSAGGIGIRHTSARDSVKKLMAL